MKKSLLLMALTATSLCQVVQASELPKDIVDRGYLSAAIVPNYPPMEFKDPATNEITGFDYDLGVALGEKLGIEIRWEETAFEQMISGLKTGRSDLVLSGMTDTPKRQEVVDFIDYLRTGPQFYTMLRNEGIKAPLDLCGKNVGGSRRTTYPDEVKAWSAANCEAADKPAITFVGTEGSADARAQLRQGRLDAAVQGSETLPYFASNEPDTYRILGKPLSHQYTGMAVSNDNEALRDALSSALDSMIEDGSYEQIIEKWGLQESAVEKVSINAGT
ncbi:ABC transporter substrate-binding protein [Salinicola halimionae]|uniref:ABC transporter substrate-binding protein n=1 Tax=Salinicola halimionae TaxID=1949081 RepID=UPI000DA1509F|nr:ABC transporter substrate-binding protein [Salinicola halimionae]